MGGCIAQCMGECFTQCLGEPYSQCFPECLGVSYSQCYPQCFTQFMGELLGEFITQFMGECFTQCLGELMGDLIPQLLSELPSFKLDSDAPYERISVCPCDSQSQSISPPAMAPRRAVNGGCRYSTPELPRAQLPYVRRASRELVVQRSSSTAVLSLYRTGTRLTSLPAFSCLRMCRMGEVK